MLIDGLSSVKRWSEHTLSIWILIENSCFRCAIESGPAYFSPNGHFHSCITMCSNIVAQMHLFSGKPFWSLIFCSAYIDWQAVWFYICLCVAFRIAIGVAKAGVCSHACILMFVKFESILNVLFLYMCRIQISLLRFLTSLVLRS